MKHMKQTFTSFSARMKLSEVVYREYYLGKIPRDIIWFAHQLKISVEHFRLLLDRAIARRKRKEPPLSYFNSGILGYKNTSYED